MHEFATQAKHSSYRHNHYKTHFVGFRRLLRQGLGDGPGCGLSHERMYSALQRAAAAAAAGLCLIIGVGSIDLFRERLLGGRKRLGVN